MQTASNRHRALMILEQLVRIESVNPHYGLDGGVASGEYALSIYIEQVCKEAGLRVTRQPVLSGRDNLIIELRNGHAERTLLFEAHMDTVSLGSMADPLLPVYRDGRLYGRGACDTKGSLAGMIYAMERCAKQAEPLLCDIVLCAAVDEEHEYRGLSKFLELGMPVAGAVVGEPTEMGIVVAHKGCARFKLTTHGKAAHSSVPEEGNNAIYQMVELIRFIREEIEPGLAQNVHALCGAPTLVISTIRGGTQINIVPECCQIEVDRRMIPGEDCEQVLSELKQRIEAYARQRDIRVDMETLLIDWALDTSPDSLIVRQAGEVASTLGLSHEPIGVTYGSDASKLQHFAQIPSIVFGPGSIAQAHSICEWVPVKEVEQAAEFYLRLAQSFGHG